MENLIEITFANDTVKGQWYGEGLNMSHQAATKVLKKEALKDNVIAYSRFYANPVEREQQEDMNLVENLAACTYLDIEEALDELLS